MDKAEAMKKKIIFTTILAMLSYVILIGLYVDIDKVQVKHVTYESVQLPRAFDGYRIVQMTDAHLGTFTGARKALLKAFVDSVNALHPDMVVFTGDLQNRRPNELYEHIPTLRGIKAKDGIYAVMGNHDYPMYVRDVTPEQKRAYLNETMSIIRSLGWHLLVNDNAVIRRCNDSIVIAGMDNDGNGRKFPQRGDVGKTLRGVGDKAFIVMLEHDPSAWRRKILPHTNAQLTLSGHTHAMQFEVMGWSPASLLYDEWGGMYSEGDRSIYVSTGMGALIPFRFGVPGEVVEVRLVVKI